MNIYLIRHTTPLIAKGICYGQTDLDVTDSFEEEYRMIKPHLPSTIRAIYSSPLQRCRKLANVLFPDKDIMTEDSLMELNCGSWEMQVWDEIPKNEIRPWLDNFIEVRVPGGESYTDLHDRVVNQFNKIRQKGETAVIVAHGGVLRSILAYITQTPLKESFDAFTFHYGCVIKIAAVENELTHEILYNVQLNDKEWHRPSSY
jgi:alpha-ribazole phosphatase